MFRGCRLFVFLGLLVHSVLYSQNRLDLSRFVVMGDSLGAGFQNYQLVQSGQVHGYANVIATQAGVSLNLPLFPSAYPQVTFVPFVNGQKFALPTGFQVQKPSNTSQTMDLGV